MTGTVKMDVLDTTSPNSILVRLVKDPAPDDFPFHRFSLEPLMDLDRVFAAVNANLEGLGYSAIAADDESAIRAAAEAKFTPDVIAAYQASLDAAGE